MNHWAGRIPTGEYEFFIDSQDRTIASWIGIDRNWFYWDAADLHSPRRHHLDGEQFDRAGDLLVAQTAEAEHAH